MVEGVFGVGGFVEVVDGEDGEVVGLGEIEERAKGAEDDGGVVGGVRGCEEGWEGFEDEQAGVFVVENVQLHRDVFEEWGGMKPGRAGATR